MQPPRRAAASAAVKGDEKRSKASAQFEKLGMLSALGEGELHDIFTTASPNLLEVHKRLQ